MATPTLPTNDDLRKRADAATEKYWDLHSLLYSAEMIVDKFDDGDPGVPELKTLLSMASMKADELEACLNPETQSLQQGKPNV